MDYIVHAVTNSILFKPPPRQTKSIFPRDARNTFARALSTEQIHCQLTCPWDSCSTLENYIPTTKIFLYLHGNNEDINSSRTYRQWICNHAHLNVLTCDYTGYGFSTGETSEEGMHDAASALLDLAMSKLNHTPDQIIVIGKSIGSTPAISLASNVHMKNLCGLILLSPIASGARCLSFSHRLPAYVLKKLDALLLPNIDKINAVQCPIQFVHGLQDQVVPCSNSYSLITAHGKRLYTDPWFVEAGHNDIESRYTSSFLHKISDFVEVCTQRSAVTVPYHDTHELLVNYE